MMVLRRALQAGQVLATAAVLFGFWSCSDSGPASPGSLDPGAIGTSWKNLTGIVLSPDSTTLSTGGTQQFTVVGQTTTGATVSVQVSFTVTGGKISNAGLYRAGGGPGVYQVIATQKASGLADTSTVIVTNGAPAAPAQVTVTPSADSLPGVGSTVQLVAQAYDASGNPLAGQSYAWSSSNAAVATVTSAGLVTAAGAGTASITATAGTAQGSASVTVADYQSSSGLAPAAPAGLVVSTSPKDASTFQVTATWQAVSGAALYSWNTGSNSGGWSTQGTTIQTNVTIAANLLSNANGYFFCVSSVDAAGNLSPDPACKSFQPPSAGSGAVSTVSVTPSSASLAAGGTTQLAAHAYDANNTELSGQTFTWSSSNTAVASVSAVGLVTAVSAGSATITAADGTVQGTSSVTVTVTAPTVASVSITPSSATLTAVGATTQLTPHAYSSTGAEITGLTFTWSSSNTAVATVNSSGLVTAAGAGTASIRATTAGIQGSASITVSTSTSAPATGSGEPTYNAAVNRLILTDGFDQYSSNTALLNAYPAHTTSANTYVTLTTGRGGSGRAARLAYGPSSTTDIKFGPEGRLGSVGAWNGTLPQVAGPYAHFLFSTWIRFSSGWDPTNSGAGGLKGLMFWLSSNEHPYDPYYSSSDPHYDLGLNGRNEYAVTNRGATPSSGVTYFPAQDWGAHYPAQSYPSGTAPVFLNDGQWHRYTVEIRTDASFTGNNTSRSSAMGCRIWRDGTLVWDDVGKLDSGTLYRYWSPISHWAVFGNGWLGSPAQNGTIDFDDWIAWTD